MPVWEDPHLRTRRLSACLRLVSHHGADSVTLEEAIREVHWPGRQLEWHDSKAPSGLGCGFNAADLFMESSNSEQEDLPPTMWLAPAPESSSSLGWTSTPPTLVICGSAESPDSEEDRDFATLLLECLRQHFAPMETLVLQSAQVVLVSKAKRIPIMALPEGLASLHLPTPEMTVETGCKMLDQTGIFVIPDAIGPTETENLRLLAIARITDAEQALQLDNKDIGCGDFSYAEIIHRGKERWDLVVHKDGERVGPGDAAADLNFEVLEQVALEGPWVTTMQRMLGDFKWEAGVVCSRPGAVGQGWHSDSVHSKYSFDGESGPAHSLCVFVPLVPLESATVAADGTVKHGRGCTGFWPGSHKFRECPHLGAVAANQLDAVVPGAPVRAGAAIVYDLRVVHCGSPNDAFDLPIEEAYRPILQISYYPKSSKKGNAFGYEQLFYD